MNLRKTIKRIATPILQPLSKWYLSKERAFEYQGIKIKVLPSVFHPGLFISTKILLQFLSDKPLRNKTFLELGAGSGIISILAAKKGAQVTASDINPTAIRNIESNARQNEVNLQLIHSDLFDRFPQRCTFDWVIINPPYYPNQPANEGEYAFFCGPKFEYFQKLFAQLPHFKNEQSTIFMILSEDCDRQNIEKIARKHQLHLTQIFEKKVLGEWNYIYQIY